MVFDETKNNNQIKNSFGSTKKTLLVTKKDLRKSFLEFSFHFSENFNLSHLLEFLVKYYQNF
jgi:hypothetical protein